MMQRKKNNKYLAESLPEMQLDFHEFGVLSVEEIEKMTTDFLMAAAKNGVEKVLLITGKGLHSRGGEAVVKPTVFDLLRRLDVVKNFSIAPIHQGGAGAFLVFLS